MTPKPRLNADTSRTQRLSERFAKSLQPSTKRNERYYDSEVKGFGLRVTDTGFKSFVLNYYVNGRERRLTIGPYPEWSVTAARKQAAMLRRMIDTGVDPLDER